MRKTKSCRNHKGGKEYGQREWGGVEGGKDRGGGETAPITPSIMFLKHRGDHVKCTRPVLVGRGDEAVYE